MPKYTKSQMLYNNIWKHILSTVKYNNKPNFLLSSTQIKLCQKSWKGKKNQFEPRLLCKQDTLDSRPDIFKRKNIFLLPVNNGNYMLTNVDIYKTLEYTDTPIIPITRNLSSTVLHLGKSETSLIDNLRYAGVFERPDLLGEPILYGSLLNGRHRCNFTMSLDDKPISVTGTQFETDACYETLNNILLIECKNISSNSFNIRQLYYPYRYLYDQGEKHIIPLFINKTKDDIIHIWKYTFTNPDDLSSLTLLKHLSFEFKK